MTAPQPNPAAYKSESAILKSGKRAGALAERFYWIFHPVSMAVKKTTAFGMLTSYEIPITVYSPETWNVFVTKTKPFFEQVGVLLNRPNFVTEALTTAAALINEGFFPSINHPSGWDLQRLGIPPSHISQIQQQLDNIFKKFSISQLTRLQTQAVRKELVLEQHRLDKTIETLNAANDWIAKVSNVGLSSLLSTVTFGVSDLILLHRAAKEHLEKLFKKQQDFLSLIDKEYYALSTDAQRASFLKRYQPIFGTPATRALLELSKSTLVSLFGIPPLKSAVAEQLAPPLGLVEAMTAPQTQEILEKRRSIISSFLAGIFEAYENQIKRINPFISGLSTELGNTVDKHIQERALEAEEAAKNQLPWWSTVLSVASLAVTILPRGPNKTRLIASLKNPKMMAFGFPFIVCLLAVSTAAGLVATYISETAVANLDATIQRAVEEQKLRAVIKYALIIGAFLVAIIILKKLRRTKNK